MVNLSDLYAWFRDVGFTPGALGIWTGVFAFVQWRAKERRLDRKLSLEDRQANREGFTKELDALRVENRKLLADQAELRKEYDEYRHFCQAETDELRSMVIRLQNEMQGYKRRLDTGIIASNNEGDVR